MPAGSRTAALTVSPAQVRSFRVAAQQLDRSQGTLAGTAVLDIGVQDTGPDGGMWALAIRGIDVGAVEPDDLATIWSVRGAPHIYRRADLPKLARAVEPYSDHDAGKRIFDAAKPLKQAGIGNLEALDTVAGAMRAIVRKPTVKGEVSTSLTAVLDPPYLRFCRPCNATHVFEQPFRLAAFRAGLELQPGTSPPVLQRIPRFKPAAKSVPRFDLVRAYLHLLGPATPNHVAAYLDAPLADVTARWPVDTVEVSVGGQTRWVLSGDADRLDTETEPVTRLLGPFDLFLQARDRDLLVADRAHAKAMWPVLGRPGGILHGGDVVGMWRPRRAGRKLSVQVDLWSRDTKATRSAIHEQAERLAAHRGVALGGLSY